MSRGNFDAEKKKPERSSKLKVVVEKDSKEVRYVSSICGIYLMHIGEYFYCGRSVDIHRRAYQHQYELGKLLKQYSSQPLLIPEIHYLKNVLYQLIINPDIYTLRIEIVETCTNDNIMKREQIWLDKSKKTGRSLNVGYVSAPSSGDVKKLNLIKNKCLKN